MKMANMKRDKLEKSSSKRFARMGLAEHSKEQKKLEKKQRTEKNFSKGMAQNSLSQKGNKKAYADSFKHMHEHMR